MLEFINTSILSLLNLKNYILYFAKFIYTLVYSHLSSIRKSTTGKLKLLHIFSRNSMTNLHKNPLGIGRGALHGYNKAANFKPHFRMGLSNKEQMDANNNENFLCKFFHARSSHKFNSTAINLSLTAHNETT